LTFLAGQPATAVQSAPRNRLQGFAILKLGLAPERGLLRERLDRRASAMFHAGLLEETQALLDAGFSPHAKPLQSLGYKQAVQVISGELTLERAIRECQAKTRQYAKRQMTWFRHEPGIHWLDGFGSDAPIQQEALAVTRAFLARHWSA
jgi:tRNA dimethylallyltransferase